MAAMSPAQAERQAVANRARAAGRVPTTRSINQTVARNAVRRQEAERQAVRNRARLLGKEPTTTGVTATIAKNEATRAAAAYSASATGPDREAIRARAIATGHIPTTSGINATYRRNKARRLAFEKANAPQSQAKSRYRSVMNDNHWHGATGE
jgi:hypothetical protein